MIYLLQLALVLEVAKYKMFRLNPKMQMAVVE
jgi:hypothetical protein